MYMGKEKTKGDFTMKIIYHAQAGNRKALADAISRITGARKVYKGIPSYAYEIDSFTIDREGNLNFDDRTDSEEVENLIEKLAGLGFSAEPTENQAEAPRASVETQQPQMMGITISLPQEGFTDTALENLQKLVASKASLIQKAFGRTSLPIEVKKTQIDFPWLDGTEDADVLQARTAFIAALCRTAKNQKRVTAKEKLVENEKYAFRCFLLRLGFIGREYAKERKILLGNLSGSAAFKGGAKHEVSQ